MLRTVLCLALAWSGLSVSPPAAPPASAPATGSLRGTIDLGEGERRLGAESSIDVPEIVLRRELEGWHSDPRSDSTQPKIWRTSPDDRGVFRFADLIPGNYWLEARSGDLSLELHSLRIVAGQENALPARLVLAPKARLGARLTPAADPWHRPWRLKLLEPRTGNHEVRYLAEAATDDSGLGILRNLAPGEALLRVEDEDGRTWLEQPVEVYPEAPEIFLSVDVVAVEGRLSFGSEPLAAELSFGTTQSGADIRMKSADNGKFSGYLPNEGLWAVELLLPGDPYDAQRLRDVEVRRRPGKSYADVEIRVPETRLEGKVLFKGEPVPDAGITVVREKSEQERKERESGVVREAVLTTDSAGRFRLQGLEGGTLAVLAVRGRESSEWQRFELREGSWPSEIVLELEERETLRGLVVSGPAPVAGAQIVASAVLADPTRALGYLEAATSPDGTFELSVPASLPSLDLLVAAPALGVELMRIEKTEKGWAPLILSLGGEGGTLHSQVTMAEGARDLGFGLIFRRNGASLRWMPVVRILTALGRLEFGAGEIVLRGMAPGPWEVCLEGRNDSCRSGILMAGGELTLTSPRGPVAAAAALSGGER